MAKQKQQESNTIETRFASDFTFKGSVHSEEVVLVQGKVEGTIDSTVEVYVSKRASIAADISAKNVVNYGIVHGNIRARDTVEIYDSAQIHGNVYAFNVTIQKGAVLDGQYTVGNSKES